MSNRYRANKSITNKVTNLSSRISTEEKSTADPHLSVGTVVGANIEPESVQTENLAPDSTTDTQLTRGSVGTENLGVVNQITSDGDMELVVPGDLIVTATTTGTGHLNTPHGAWGQMAGLITATGSSQAVDATVSVAITFPVGKFTVPPILVVSGTASRCSYGYTEAAVTTTAATLVSSNWSSAAQSANYKISWIAVQMTPTTAAG